MMSKSKFKDIKDSVLNFKWGLLLNGINAFFGCLLGIILYFIPDFDENDKGYETLLFGECALVGVLVHWKGFKEESDHNYSPSQSWLIIFGLLTSMAMINLSICYTSQNLSKYELLDSALVMFLANYAQFCFQTIDKFQNMLDSGSIPSMKDD